MAEAHATERVSEGRPSQDRTRTLFHIVMAWTVFTSVFAWLPIVRALARPDGYSWALFGLRGEGLQGPFWVFPAMALYALLLFTHSWWSRRDLFRALLLIWHLGWAGALAHAAFSLGNAARWRGEGWGFNFPIPAVAVIYALFAMAVVWWVYTDWRQGAREHKARWTARNSRRLGLALLLLPAAWLLFRLGSDFDWVTAIAIGVTVLQWVTLSESLGAFPAAEEGRPTTG